MPAAVLDTSVIVRLLTRDDAQKAAAAQSYLQEAEDSALLMPDVALAEVGFVLLRVYRWPADRVADALRAVVTHRAIEVPGQDLWLEVADDVEDGRTLVDAYLLRIAEHEGINTVLTFDERMRPLAGVRCVAP